MEVDEIDSSEFFAAPLKPLRPPGSGHVLGGGENQVDWRSSGKAENER
jgi:hypothetical protein